MALLLSIPVQARNIKETTITDETFYTDVEQPLVEYIDVDIESQTVKYIDHDKVVFESLCVSGNADGRHNTPKGRFELQCHTRNVRLKGPTWDCPVSYWMKFTDDGCGFHDATWRGKGEFGGDTYKYNGSHGCVNMTLDDVKELYELVDTGTVVIIH